MKIYTRTGDKGTTSLYNGQRVAKSHELIHATGAVDECNATLGLCAALLRQDPITNRIEAIQKLIMQIESIQTYLFSIGAHISTPRGSSDEVKEQRTRLISQPTQDLENWIDSWQVQLPPLRHFILPGGGIAAATLHQARCQCRHAERRLCSLYEKKLIDPEAIEYINRLSDYLFVAARVVNNILGLQETPWKSTTQG